MGKFCTNCGKGLQDEDLFCDGCGTKAKEEGWSNSSEPETVKTPQSNDVTFDYSNPIQKPKKKSGCLIVFIFFIAVVSVCFAIAMTNLTTNKEKIVTATGASETEAQKISDILELCKVGDIKSISYDENLDISEVEGEKGYRIENNLSPNIILYLNPDLSVNSIRYADRDFYKNGEQLLSFEDFIISGDEQTEYQIKAMDYVKGVLKSPSTAKFPNILEWSIWKEDGIYIIQSYVDAQNGFGALVRSEFQIKSDGDEVISFILDGEELIR